MKIQELLTQTRNKVGREGDHLGVELLLAFVLKKDGTYLLTHNTEEVSKADEERFYALIERMLKGEPVAYILGHKEFFGLDFFVDKRVLIPRPETEHLVEYILNFCTKNFSNSGVASKPEQLSTPRILDVGTGSGCIAISIAKNLPSAQVTAVDISPDAIEVATINAQNNHVQVKFLQSDLFAEINDPFDIVVANLPYIGEKRFSFVSTSTYDYEPHLALFAGEDGLALYDRFLKQLSEQSWKPRLLVGEFGFLQRDELSALFARYFFDVEVRFFEDYAHIDRMFVVEFPAISKF